MNSSDFLRIHDIALADILNPTTEFYYRNICRWYSEKFHTPLHIVEKELQPSYILKHYYESTLSLLKEDDLDGVIFRALNPDYEEDSEEEIQEFVRKIEEEARLKKSANKQQSIKDSFKVSEASKIETVSRSYDEPPPPEASSNPDHSLDSTPKLGNWNDEEDF